MKSSFVPAGPVDRLDVGAQLDQVAGDEARGEAEPAQDLHQQPGAVAAGAGAQRQRLVRRLHARLHADDVANRLLQSGVEPTRKSIVRSRRAADLRDEPLQQRAERLGLEIGGELGREFVGVGEGKVSA